MRKASLGIRPRGGVPPHNNVGAFQTGTANRWTRSRFDHRANKGMPFRTISW